MSWANSRMKWGRLGAARVVCVALLAVAIGCDDGSSGGGAADVAGATADAGAGGAGGGIAPGRSRGPGAGADGAGTGGQSAGAGAPWGEGGGAGGGEGGGAWDEGWGAGGAGGGPGGGAEPPRANTNVNLGGAQDFGFVRRLLADGIVPAPDEFDAAGFFAEHHTPLPEPDCGERVCVQAMLGVMGNLVNGSDCTMVQVGLNSPIAATEDQRPPLNLAVVIDTSGSMAADGKMEFVRDGLDQMISELYDDDQLAIVTYSSDADVVTPMQPIRGQRNALRTIAQSLQPGGSTNLYDGLEFGYAEVFRNYDSGRQNRVILLSDGNPTAGTTSPVRIVEMSTAYNSDGVGLTTVGLGTDFNHELMRSLAEQADGNFYFLENPAAVTEVFTEELAYFTVPVAFDLELSVTARPGYRFQRAFGSRLWEDAPDRRGGSLSVPSVFLAHRVSHDDVTEGGGRRGGGSALLLELMPIPEDQLEEDSGYDAVNGTPVAKVHARFREPGSDRIIEDEVVVRYPHAPTLLLREGFFDNTIVEKSFVMLNIYVGMVMASESFYVENAPEAAVDQLSVLRAAVADYNSTRDDVDIAFDLELLDSYIEVLLDNGGRPTPPEEIPEDGWPRD